MSADAELQERIARLEARAEIRDCIDRYARGMDRRDREILRSAYHDGAIDDHVGFVGEVDDFIDWVSKPSIPAVQPALGRIDSQFCIRRDDRRRRS